ncbi:MAG: hypothetical protein AB1440_06960, partial [Pseudomonadota bacterium]
MVPRNFEPGSNLKARKADGPQRATGNKGEGKYAYSALPGEGRNATILFMVLICANDPPPGGFFVFQQLG